MHQTIARCCAKSMLDMLSGHVNELWVLSLQHFAIAAAMCCQIRSAMLFPAIASMFTSFCGGCVMIRSL